MQHKLYHLHQKTLTWHFVWYEGLLCLFLALMIFVAPVSASMRFQDRSLYMESASPGATTAYTISFRYMSAQSVGSVAMDFCINPIPYIPCVTPPGLDVSNATLTSQSGETGFTISSKSTNRIVLSRSSTMVSQYATPSSYTLEGVVNPSTSNGAFSIRMSSYGSSDATGNIVDFGTVRGQATTDIVLETQVPPMLIFCAAQQVTESCRTTSDKRYSDMGELSAQSTLTAQSQMAVGTNATAGFAITVIGPTLSSGIHTIENIDDPTQSIKGVNQFGINLVQNNTPAIGNDPEGDWANAVAAPGYNTPNEFQYTPGEVVAYSPNVSLMRKFTISYIVNSEKDLHPGVYSTTINYVASGRF